MRKKHRREKNSSRRSNRFSAERGGPIGRPAGRPYNGIILLLGKELLARPVQEMIHALWFLGITALLPGRAMPEIQQSLRPFAEK
jgi:hypothetical protein